jgi:hypothetical protein
LGHGAGIVLPLLPLEPDQVAIARGVVLLRSLVAHGWQNRA